ncbi:MAG: hypothetical protein M5U34_02115 [Chloroflexi bacterium]|nr:hypothetical protein [Chloroflexota bacterium]
MCLFENDSGDHAYHARLILRGEPLYGDHHPDHHMPGVFTPMPWRFNCLANRWRRLRGCCWSGLRSRWL